MSKQVPVLVLALTLLVGGALFPPTRAMAQQSVAIVGDALTALLAIEAATEGAEASLNAIEVGMSQDAVFANSALASGPQVMLEAKDQDGAAFPNTVTEGQATRASASTSGVLYVMPVNEDGSAVSTVNAALASGTNYAGRVRLHDGTNDGLLDPCQTVAKTTTAFSQTTIANIITADVNKTNYICAIVIVASAAEAVSVVEDDTSGCGSLTAALAGSTTAANGMSLAANGGFTLGNGQSTVLAGSANNRYLCIAQDGSDRISGSITWVQR